LVQLSALAPVPSLTASKIFALQGRGNGSMAANPRRGGRPENDAGDAVREELQGACPTSEEMRTSRQRAHQTKRKTAGAGKQPSAPSRKEGGQTSPQQKDPNRPQKPRR
jgi:hypothetical protein